MPEGVIVAVLASTMVAAVGLPLVVRARSNARPLERWARGAYGLLTGGQDFAELGRDEARALLESPWGVANANALRETIATMDAGESDELAWDLVRVLLLARLGVAAGYLDAADSWATILRAATRLQAHYPDWRSLGSAYARGRSAWLRARGITDATSHGLVERNMQLLERRVWPKMEYRAPLG